MLTIWYSEGGWPNTAKWQKSKMNPFQGDWSQETWLLPSLDPFCAQMEATSLYYMLQNKTGMCSRWNSHNTKTLLVVWHQWVLCSTLQAFVKRRRLKGLFKLRLVLNLTNLLCIVSGTGYAYTHAGHVSAVLLISGTFFLEPGSAG